eukprot:CAMPEP_0196583458 /NCGR_PEP_ID=MMETSP1081-20130531/43727_1 /TAXON_ID=36882 /ORGANISM="Pyramimonas amylifera, Strain CCMP720" /LENGTH=233 /DNA_ID=CAMNT_0041904361 /DNA_START=215 /DNA_END=916 /DNA_ORIENTATION=-
MCSEENEGLITSHEEMHLAVAERERKIRYLEQQNQEMLSRLNQAQQINSSIFERAENTSTSLSSRLASSESALQQASAQIEMMEARHKVSEKKFREMEVRLDEVRRERDAWKMRTSAQDRTQQDLQAALEASQDQLTTKEAEDHVRLAEWQQRCENEIRLREQAETQERAMARKCRHLEHEVSLLGSQRAALESSLQTKCELDWPYRKVVKTRDNGRIAKSTNLPFSDLYMGF